MVVHSLHFALEKKLISAPIYDAYEEERISPLQKLRDWLQYVFSGADERMSGLEGVHAFNPERYAFLIEAASEIEVVEPQARLSFRRLISPEKDREFTTSCQLNRSPEFLGMIYEGLLDYEIIFIDRLTLLLTENLIPCDLQQLFELCPDARLDYLKQLKITPSKKQTTHIVEARTFDELVESLSPCVNPLSPHPWESQTLLLARSRQRGWSGSHYTPRVLTEWIVGQAIDRHLDQQSKSSITTLTTLKLCDPSMGTGAFLLEACRQICRRLMEIKSSLEELPDERLASLNSQTATQRFIIQHCLFGVDQNPLAVELAKRSLWLLIRDPSLKLTQLIHNLSCGDSLINPPSITSVIQNPSRDLSVQGFSWSSTYPEIFKGDSAGFDVVIGNPPWLSLSGKGSPIARLRALGQPEAADQWLRKITLISQRFPDLSRGSKDYYKWFVGLALQLLKPSGSLAFLLPSTMLTLSKNQNVREQLSRFSQLHAYELGRRFFNIQTSVALVVGVDLQAHRSNEKLIQLYSSQGQAHDMDDLTQWRVEQATICSGALQRFRSSFSRRAYLSPLPRLGHFIEIHEGHHLLRYQDPQELSWIQLPALNIKTLKRMRSPDLCHGFLPIGSSLKYHQGPRFFIRKTGDQLVAAISPTDDLAVAHQNVYVCHKFIEIPLSTISLCAMVCSKILTRLYQEGPHGQRGKSLAQLRIYALRALPMPPIEEIKSCEAELERAYLLKRPEELDLIVQSLYQYLT